MYYCNCYLLRYCQRLPIQIVRRILAHSITKWIFFFSFSSNFSWLLKISINYNEPFGDESGNLILKTISFIGFWFARKFTLKLNLLLRLRSTKISSWYKLVRFEFMINSWCFCFILDSRHRLSNKTTDYDKWWHWRLDSKR